MLRLSRLLAAVTVGLVAGGALAARWVHWMPDPGHTEAWCAQLLSALGFGFVGVALAERVEPPADRVAWLLQLVGVTQAAGLLAGSWARHPGAVGAGAAAWCDGWVWALGVLPAVTVLPLVFPTGRSLPGGWAWVTGCAVVVSGAATLLQGVLAWPGDHPSWWQTPPAVATVVLAVLGLVSLVVRFRRGGPVERAQIKWVALAVAALLVWEPVQSLVPRPVAAAGLALLPLLIPVAVGLAVVRYRLYDVDLVISRSASYVILSAVLTGVYVGAALVVGERSAGVDRLAVATVLFVALVAAPLRGYIQGHLDRWLLGNRSAHLAVRRLAGRLQGTIAPDEVPDAVVRTVVESLRLPYVRLVVGHPDAAAMITVASGRPRPGTDLPVTYAGRQVGVLTLGRRGPREPLAAPELQLLRTLVDAAAPALDGLLLTADLREARQRTVLAREGERKRLHRDLHDGLGPTLAGIALGLDAVHNLAERQDLAGVLSTLDRLRTLAHDATADVRTVVDGLRPPALDERGLVDAVRRHAEVVTAGVQVEVCVDGDLADLPDAVEVAALHIALEALTNVRRHAAAGHCWVRFVRSGQELRVEVEDDGAGPPAEIRPGVGVRSMRERAEELGGRSVWTRSPHGGVAVRASLPLGGLG